jgi:hypothetical protein
MDYVPLKESSYLSNIVTLTTQSSAEPQLDGLVWVEKHSASSPNGALT